MKVKKIWITIIGILIVLASIFFIGRYGWKLRGFDACESAGIESVSVSEKHVEIHGYAPGLVPDGFLGYYAEEQDGKLYVGFKFSGIFGFFETGDFKIQIPVEGEIHDIYMKTKQSEYRIWTDKDFEDN